MKNLIAMSGLAPLVLLGVCPQTAGAKEAADKDAIISHLRALEQAQNDQANSHGVGSGNVVITADDVMVVFPEGPPVTGVSPQLAATINNEKFHIETTPGKAWVADSGDLAVTVADVEVQSTTQDGTPTSQKLTREFVWTKDGDSDWKVVTIFNAGRLQDTGSAN